VAVLVISQKIKKRHLKQAVKVAKIVGEILKTTHRKLLKLVKKVAKTAMAAGENPNSRLLA